MGKKKSVVLMTLLTIVIVVLCAITAFPSFYIPGSDKVKKWNPAVLQYDLSMDLGGGYYAYYYPEGVISEDEYERMLSEDKEELEASYRKHGGLYLSTDPEDGIMENGAITEEFKTEFKAAEKEIRARYEAKDYAEYRVSVVDSYALRIELPASENTDNQTSAQYASQALSLLALTGDLTIEKGGETVDELKEEDATAKDLIKSISVDTKYEVAYVRVKFTSKGKEMVKAFKDGSSSSSDNSQTQSTLDIKVGDEAILSVSTDYITENNNIMYPVAQETDIRYAETLSIVLNSALKNGGYGVQFRSLTSSDIRSFAPIYGDNVLTLLFIALAIVIVAILVGLVVKMGRYGVVGVYSSLSYFIITALCFAFISGGVFVVSLGSVLVFLAGLVLINVLHYHVYNTIKKEFDLGKTVESSVKGGFNKTIWGIVDIYAVLLLGALALFVGTAGFVTLAQQALICIVAGAFCNLLWTRAINFTFLSASKNKYKYFRFVREDDDDE